MLLRYVDMMEGSMKPTKLIHSKLMTYAITEMLLNDFGMVEISNFSSLKQSETSKVVTMLAELTTVYFRGANGQPNFVWTWPVYLGWPLHQKFHIYKTNNQEHVRNMVAMLPPKLSVLTLEVQMDGQ